MKDQQANDHFGETKVISNHVHDLIHDLNNRLDAVWRYDQYIANAEKCGAEDITKHWQEAKTEDERIISRAKSLLQKYIGASDQKK